MRTALVPITLAILGSVPRAHAEAAPAPSTETPLLAYALEQEPPAVSLTDYASKRLRAITAELERNPPPPNAECAQTLGASRFARTYEDLAALRLSEGDFDAAIEAHEAALACAPRTAWIYASLGSLYLSLARPIEAREIVERGRAIDPDDVNLLAVLARIDFIEERWADATARLRVVAKLERDDNRATFYQCFLWLAQRRAGMRQPELVTRDPYDEWPTPLLEMLRGHLTEAELVEKLRELSGARAFLTEALYYVGELRLAEGNTEAARRHFAAAVNLKVLNYIEHGMAFAELARMRSDQY